MATNAQILANQANAQHSCGPTSIEGKQTSSQNRTTHGLCNHQSFYLLKNEDPDKFIELRQALRAEHQPQTETESILVRRMADHEWLRTRALRLQHGCLSEDQHVDATAQFALYMRYQTTHERAFYKALNELQKLRAERRKAEIGFESQKRQQPAEQPAAEAHNPEKQEFKHQKERIVRYNQPEKIENDLPEPATTPSETAPTPDSSPGDLEMCA